MSTTRTSFFVGTMTCLGLALTQTGLAGPIVTSDTSKSKIVIAETESGQPWWVELGPVYRGDMSIGLSGGSRSQGMPGRLALPSGVGAATGYADRTYSDGYVRRDAGTGNPNSLVPNGTWYWGYNNASQANSTAGTLSFHATGDAAYVPDAVRNASASAHADAVGLELATGRTLLETGGIRIDLAAGFQTGWGLENRLQISTFHETLQQLAVTDTYAVSGVALPPAGYRGVSAGPFAPGVSSAPVIPNQPASRSVESVGLGWSAANAIRLDATSDLYELWIGPRIAVQAAPWLSLYVNPRVGVTCVNVDASRSEYLIATGPGGAKAQLGAWRDNASETDWLFTGGVTGGANMRLSSRVFLDVFAGYEWVNKTLNVQVGPNRLSINPSGCVAGAAVGVKF